MIKNPALTPFSLLILFALAPSSYGIDSPHAALFERGGGASRSHWSCRLIFTRKRTDRQTNPNAPDPNQDFNQIATQQKTLITRYNSLSSQMGVIAEELNQDLLEFIAEASSGPGQLNRLTVSPSALTGPNPLLSPRERTILEILHLKNKLDLSMAHGAQALNLRLEKQIKIIEQHLQNLL